MHLRSTLTHKQRRQMTKGKRIPIKAAKRIAREFGYEQVIIVARNTGDTGKEWCTTYGETPAHCAAAAKIGEALRGLAAGTLKLVRPSIPRPEGQPE